MIRIENMQYSVNLPCILAVSSDRMCHRTGREVYITVDSPGFDCQCLLSRLLGRSKSVSFYKLTDGLLRGDEKENDEHNLLGIEMFSDGSPPFTDVRFVFRN